MKLRHNSRLAVCSLILALTCQTAQAAPVNPPAIYTVPVYAPLKGLKKLKLEVKITRDVKNQLEHIGAPAPLLGEELSHLAKKKLKMSGIDTDGLDKGPVLWVLVDADLATDELTVTLRLSDLIAPVRQPDAQFTCNLWQVKGHPTSDESGPLKEVLEDLMDRFIADSVAANAKQ